MSFKEWRNAILQVDSKSLNSGLVDQLRNALPPVEMIHRLKQYSSGEEIQKMPEGEQANNMP